MESKDELQNIGIKNRTYYYFDDIMAVKYNKILFYNFILYYLRDITLLEKKTYENILIYDISYKTFIASKPLCNRFDEIDGFIKIYNGIRYLVLFGHFWYDERIRLMIGLEIL